MGYALACCIVGRKIGLLQIGRRCDLCHEQCGIVSEVLNDPCIPLIDQRIVGRDILALDGLFVGLTKLEGETNAVDCSLLFRSIGRG